MQQFVLITVLVALLATKVNPRPPQETKTAGYADGRNYGYRTAGWGLGWPPGPVGSRSWPCETALQTLRDGISNQSTWAFQMMDSSAFAPTGLIFGSNHQLGHYEECMDISAPAAPFWGKYCLAKVRLDWRQSQSFEEGTVWNKIWTSTLVKSMNHRDWINWGFCIPTPCSPVDGRDILSSHLESLRGALHVGDKGVTVGEVSCRTMDPRKVELNPEGNKPLTRGQLIMSTFLMVLVSLVLTATVFEEWLYRGSSSHSDTYELNSRAEDSLWVQLLFCFSIRRNWARLTKARPPGEPPGPFDSIHGLKTSTMVLVIVGHRNFFTIGSPMFNTQSVEAYYTRPETALAMGGTALVDTYFFISGCLLAHGMLESRAKFRSFSRLPLLYLRRYIRLVPIFMVIVAFYATLLPRIGYGPLWDSRIGKEREHCVENWWINLLLVQNFVRPETMCVIQSWYVAVEFHCFLMCAPLAILLCRHRRIGLYALATATLISILIPFVLTIVDDLEALLMPFIPVLQDLVNNETYIKVYIPTYMRAVPYFMGMLCALAIRWANKNRFKMPKLLVVVFHICSFLLCLVVCYAAWIFFRPEANHSAIAAASFAVLARIGWSLAMAWQVFGPATGHGWWVGRFFAWRPLVPFGRLTYAAFLTHAGIELYDAAAMATPKNVSIFTLFQSNLSDFAFSHFLAMILYLCIESPLVSLEKLVIGTPSTEGNTRITEIPQNGASVVEGVRRPPASLPLMKEERRVTETHH